MSAEESHPLDKIIKFLKDNWKEVAADMIKAGLAAYVAHQVREKLKDQD
jgi:hypothetical protein